MLELGSILILGFCPTLTLYHLVMMDGSTEIYGFEKPSYFSQVLTENALDLLKPPVFTSHDHMLMLF
jgi:hypothetical protein